MIEPREVVAKKKYEYYCRPVWYCWYVVQNIWKKNLWKYEKSNTKVVMEVNDDV